MIRKQKRFNHKKPLFKSYYCQECKQRKSCGKLNQNKNYCCPCYREILEELEKDKLLTSSFQRKLNNYRSRIIACQCLGAEKTRAKYLSSDGSGWIKCERSKCKRIIASAGHHGVIKNRNDPRFWGLAVKEKVLCGDCLEAKKGKIKSLRRAEFNRYRKVGRL